MTTLMIVNFITPLFSLIGMILIAHKYKIAFIVFLIVEISLAYIGYTNKQYGLIAMSIIYILSNIYSYIIWSKEEDKLKMRNLNTN